MEATNYQHATLLKVLPDSTKPSKKRCTKNELCMFLSIKNILHVIPNKQYFRLALAIDVVFTLCPNVSIKLKCNTLFHWYTFCAEKEQNIQSRCKNFACATTLRRLQRDNIL